MKKKAWELLKSFWDFWIIGSLRILLNVYIGVVFGYYAIITMMHFGYMPPTLFHF